MSKTLEKEDAEMTAEVRVGAGEIEKASSKLISEVKEKSEKYSMYMKFVDAKPYEYSNMGVVVLKLKAKKYWWFSTPIGWDIQFMDYEGNGVISLTLVKKFEVGK